MIHLRTALAALLALGLTVAGGVLHGRMSDRWGPPPKVIAAAERLMQVPDEFGDWQLLGTGTLPKAAREQLQCAACLVRRYSNRQTGAQVTLLLMLGPAGRMAVHSPEVCVAIGEYKQRGHRELVNLAAADELPERLWSVDFQSVSLEGGAMRVYYGWSTGGAWQAPSDARFALAGVPYLYKVQVSTDLGLGPPSKEKDSGRKFLEEFTHVVGPFLITP